MSLMGGIKPWITSTPWRRKCIISSWKESASPCSVPALAAIATWKSQVSTSVRWVNSSGPKSPKNFGSMTEINTKKIWWIGETPWKQKHWKHQELVFHSTRPTPIGDVSGQISSTTFNPFDHFDAPVYHYPSRNHWIIESFPSVGRCHFPLWNILSTALEKIVNNRDIVRSL